MPIKYLIYLLSFTYLLSACGLETDDEEEQEVTEESILVHEQHALLPLASNTAIVYNDTSLGEVTANVSYNGTKSAEQNRNIYTISFSDDSNNLGLVVSSTSSQVALLGIEGPFVITLTGGLTATVNSLDFSDPIVLIGDVSDGSTVATANTDSGSSATYNVEYEISNSNITFDPEDDDYGILPAHQVAVTFTVEVPLPNADPFFADLNSTLTFVKGLGIVAQEGNYISFNMDSDITSLISLPYTIWFDNNAGTPSIDADSDAFFGTSNGSVHSDSYSLYNSEELDELDWLSVRVATSGAYEVVLTASENLPSDLTSVQVLFENRQFPGSWLSANVTLKQETP